MLSFEESDKQLTPSQKSELARAVLDRANLPDDMTEAQRTFCMGLECYLEYECRSDVEKYLL